VQPIRIINSGWRLNEISNRCVGLSADSLVQSIDYTFGASLTVVIEHLRKWNELRFMSWELVCWLSAADIWLQREKAVSVSVGRVFDL